MNEKCYVVLCRTLVRGFECEIEYGYVTVCAVTKTKEKAYSLIQDISESIWSERDPDAHPVKKEEHDGWKIIIEDYFETSEVYCEEQELIV